MKYFLDTEFIDTGKTIELISLGMVAEDGRELYLQSTECAFHYANDFVARNVYPHLKDFNMASRERTCLESINNTEAVQGACGNKSCSWRTRAAIRKEIQSFITDKPEFWAWYGDYDWVAFCQLFGTMGDLPKNYPHYCNDLVQWWNQLGSPNLPPKPTDAHHALADAKWNLETWKTLYLVSRNIFVNKEGGS